MKIVFFTHHRAMQLDAALRSFYECCTDVSQHTISVLVHNTDPAHAESYLRLESEHPRAHFQNITDETFRISFLRQLNEEYVLLVVDDMIFVRPFSLTKIEELLNDGDCVGFSLRLGMNIVFDAMRNEVMGQPDFYTTDVYEDVMYWSWRYGDGDWGFPLEVCSSVYPVDAIQQCLEYTAPINPNELEVVLSSFADSAAESLPPNMACFDLSRAFNVPCNKVQMATYNNAGEQHPYPADLLLQMFNEGKRIDVQAFRNFVPRATHQEVPLTFVSLGG